MNTIYNNQVCEVVEFISHRDDVVVILKRPDGILKLVPLSSVKIMTLDEETKQNKKTASIKASTKA